MVFTCVPPVGYPASGERAAQVEELINLIGVTACWYKSVICPGPTYRITNEDWQFVQPYPTIILNGDLSLIGGKTDWALPDTYVVEGSVIVTDSSGIQTYILDTDYIVDYDLGTVTRTSTGDIAWGDEVLVSYVWKEPDVDPKTGNPRYDCPICGGDGRTYDDPVEIMGLYHIPKFESPLSDVGYWRFGDVYFTVKYDSDIGIRTQNEAHLLIRDRIVINGRDYRVMSEPETMQMEQEYLGKRLHLRLLEKG